MSTAHRFEPHKIPSAGALRQKCRPADPHHRLSQNGDLYGEEDIWEIQLPKYPLPRINRHFETIGDVDLPDGTFGDLYQRMGFYVAPNGRLLTSGFYSFSPPPEYTSPNDGQGIGREIGRAHV